MDIQTRKIEFIQEFLKIQSEEVIIELEKLLKKERKSVENEDFQAMTKEELNSRIDQSEADFEAGRYKHQSEIAAKYADHV